MRRRLTPQMYLAWIQCMVRLDDHRGHRRLPQYEYALFMGVTIKKNAIFFGIFRVERPVFQPRVRAKPSFPHSSGRISSELFSFRNQSLVAIFRKQHRKTWRSQIDATNLLRSELLRLARLSSDIRMNTQKNVSAPLGRCIDARCISDSFVPFPRQLYVEMARFLQEGSHIFRDVQRKILFVLTNTR